MAETAKSKLRIFISHCSADADIAVALIDLTRASLLLPATAIRCTSVNGYRLPGGASVDSVLKNETTAAETMLGLITGISNESAYVQFELGARWGANLHLLPILAAGATASMLRGPLASMNALSCEDEGQVHQIIDDLASVLGCEIQPTASWIAQLKKLTAISLNLGKQRQKSSKTAAESAGPKPIDPIAQQVLLFLARNDREGFPPEEIAEQLSQKQIVIQHHLDELCYVNFISKDYDVRIDEHRYELANPGRAFVVKNRLIQ